MKWLTFFLVSTSITAGLPEGSSVDNGLEVTEKAMTIDFEEDLRIGPDGGEDYLIWTGSFNTVEVDHKGHMYVLDSGSNRILEFDSEGHFVRQVGGTGQGPGEFQSLYSFQILDDRSGIAFDNLQSVNHFSYFDENLKFVKREIHQPSRVFLQSATFSPNGTLIGSMYITDLINGGIVHQGILNRKYEPLLELSTAKRVIFDQTRVGDKQWWAQFLADWFKIPQKGTGVVAFGSDSSVYTAVTNRYEITKWSPDLKKILVISKQYKPLPQPEDQVMALVEPIHEEVLSLLPSSLGSLVTPQVVKKAIQLAEYPPKKNPIYAILPMENDYFLTIHDYNAVTRESKAHIFNPEGRFVGVASLPKIGVNIFAGLFGSPTKMVFKNGKAYGMVPDEDNELYLVRFSYKLRPI